MLEIIYKDENFVVINKAVNISYHGEGLHDELRASLGCDIFGVHRLDKLTSGVLIFALNSNIANLLSDLFRQKKVHKVYEAISLHRPSKKQGIIKGDMQKGRNGNWSLTRGSSNPAITKFESKLLAPSHRRYFTLYPKTGKTHQLRVALKSIAAPILGDPRYSNDQSDRMYLHCLEISFELLGREFRFRADNRFGEFWS